MEWNKYYKNQAIHGYGVSPSFIKAPVFYKGHGSGAFGNILKTVMKIGKPLLKKGAKYVAKKGIDSLADFARELVDEKPVSQAFKNSMIRQFDHSKADIAHAIKKKLQYRKKTPSVKLKRKTVKFSTKKKTQKRKKGLYL